MIRLRIPFAAVCAVLCALTSFTALADQDGLPQLDPSHFPSQLFWLALSFAVLYALMAFVALPAVQRTQEQRAETIERELAAAQAANEAARATMAQYDKALADARAAAQATVSGMAAQAARESAAKQAAQQQQLAKRLAEAEAKITATRDAAVRDVKNAAADLAGAIVAKVTATRSGRFHVS